MMKIVYLEHSGFFVELPDACFLFDYYRGEIPEIPGNKKLFVFVSHRHYDHYKKEIFRLRESVPSVFYILSGDVRRDVRKYMLQTEREELSGNTPEGQIRYVRPDEQLELEGCRICTLRSTDEGVAFLVSYGEQTIYHAGDLNAWYWEEEGEDYLRIMREAYEREIDKLAGAAVDVAFVPVDPRLEKQYAAGLDFFMRRVGAGAVFPMHFWGDYEISGRLLSEPCTADYADRIMQVSRPGQVFEIE